MQTTYMLWRIQNRVFPSEIITVSAFLPSASQDEMQNNYQYNIVDINNLHNDNRLEWEPHYALARGLHTVGCCESCS
jgi:hypothetical protein